MRMTNANVGRRLSYVVCFLLLAAGVVSAGVLTSSTTTPTDSQLADEWWPPTIITNAAQFAEGFSRQDEFYMPDDSFRWTMFTTDSAPWWVDFSAIPSLQGSDKECLGNVLYGVSARRVSLTLELLTGEIVVRTQCSDKELLRVKPPEDYQPGQWPAGSSAARMWKHWLEAKADPMWEENWGPLEPPTLVLRIELADLISEKPVWDKNLVAEIRAWEEAAAKAAAEPTKTGTPTGDGGMMMLMGGDPCTITNEAQPFMMLGIWPETNGWMTVAWESCSDHYYLVQAKAEMTNPVWELVAVVPGADGWTSWTDEDAVGFEHRFYRVLRLGSSGDYDGDGLSNAEELALGTDPTNPDTDGDGMTDGWEAQYGLNPLVNDATGDLDEDGVDNLTEYLQGRDPTKGAVPDSSGVVNLEVFTPLE